MDQETGLECGAKSVDGFDIQEGMVELAQQATAQYSSVNICVGDVMNMPYMVITH